MNTAPLIQTLYATAAEMVQKLGLSQPIALSLNLPREDVSRLAEGATDPVQALKEADLSGITWEPFEGSLCFHLEAAQVKEALAAYPATPFQRELWVLAGSHKSMAEWLDFFRAQGEAQVKQEEGAYLVFYPSGEPTPLRYVLRLEGDHVTYHRYAENAFL